MSSLVGRVLGRKEKSAEEKTRSRSKSPVRTKTSKDDPGFRRVKTMEESGSKKSKGAKGDAAGFRRTKTGDVMGHKRTKSKDKKSLEHLSPHDMITMLEMQANNNHTVAEEWFEAVKTTSTSGYFEDESSGGFLTASQAMSRTRTSN